MKLKHSISFIISAFIIASCGGGGGAGGYRTGTGFSVGTGSYTVTVGGGGNGGSGGPIPPGNTGSNSVFSTMLVSLFVIFLSPMIKVIN